MATQIGRDRVQNVSDRVIEVAKDGVLPANVVVRVWKKEYLMVWIIIRVRIRVGKIFFPDYL